MDIISPLLERISRYNIFNYLIPGSALVLIFKYYIGYTIPTMELYEAMLLYYLVGLVNSRIGSLVLRPLLTRIKPFQVKPYGEYLEAERKDPKIQDLMIDNNMYRSFVSVFLISTIGYLCGLVNCSSISSCSVTPHLARLLGLLLLCVLFICAYRRQTRFIADRINNINKPIK